MESIKTNREHYECLKMQPIDLILAANLSFIQGNIIKYISRYKNKDGINDIKKCIHYAQIAHEHRHIGTKIRMLQIGYMYCKANNVSSLVKKIIIATMQDDYYHVAKLCRKLIKEEYPNYSVNFNIY